MAFCLIGLKPSRELQPIALPRATTLTLSVRRSISINSRLLVLFLVKGLRAVTLHIRNAHSDYGVKTKAHRRSQAPKLYRNNRI